MTRIKVLTRDDMNDEQGRIYDEAQAAGWPVGGPYTAYIRIPELMRRMQDLRNGMQDGPLSARERQIAHLAIARHWGAKYPWFAQARASLAVGVEQEIIDAIKVRYPNIQGPDLKDICYATQNRQNAVRRLTDKIDLLIVVGSQNSSNSNRLQELGERAGIEAHLIDEAQEIRPEWLEGKSSVGVTAGASAPEVLVREIIERLRELGVESVVESEGEIETTVFRMPPELA